MTEQELTATIAFLSGRLHEVEQELDILKARSPAIQPLVPACPYCYSFEVTQCDGSRGCSLRHCSGGDHGTVNPRSFDEPAYFVRVKG